MSSIDGKNFTQFTKAGNKNLLTGLEAKFDYSKIIEASVAAKDLEVEWVENNISDNANKSMKLEEFIYLSKNLRSNLKALSPAIGKGVFGARIAHLSGSGFSATENLNSYISTRAFTDAPIGDFSISDVQIAQEKSVSITNFSSKYKSVVSPYGTLETGKFQAGTMSILPNNSKLLNEKMDSISFSGELGNSVLEGVISNLELNYESGTEPLFLGDFDDILDDVTWTLSGSDLTITIDLDGEDYVSDSIDITSDIIDAETTIKFSHATDNSDFSVVIGSSDVSVSTDAERDTFVSDLEDDLSDLHIMKSYSFKDINNSGYFSDTKNNIILFCDNSHSGSFLPSNTSLSLEDFSIIPVTSDSAGDGTISIVIDGVKYFNNSLGDSDNIVDHNIILTNASNDKSLHVNIADFEKKIDLSTILEAESFELLLNSALQINTGSSLHLNVNDSLSDIARKINNVSYKTGVYADIMKVSSGNYRIKIYSTKTGLDNDFSIKDGSNLMQGVSSSTVTANARDASFDFDSISISRSNNLIDDLLDNIIIELRKDFPASASADVMIEQDFEPVKKAMQDFVDSYNILKEFVAIQNERDLQGNYSETAILKNDNAVKLSINMIDNNLIRLVDDEDSGTVSLSDVGIVFKENRIYGAISERILYFDEEVFYDAVKSDSKILEKVFSNYSSTSAGNVENIIYKGKFNSLSSQLAINFEVDYQFHGYLGSRVLDNDKGAFDLKYDRDLIPGFLGDFSDVVSAISWAVNADGDLEITITTADGDDYVSDPIEITSTGILPQYTELVFYEDSSESGFSARIGADDIDISTDSKKDTFVANLKKDLQSLSVRYSYGDDNLKVNLYKVTDIVGTASPVTKAVFATNDNSVICKNISENRIFRTDSPSEIFSLDDGDSFTITVVRPHGSSVSYSLSFLETDPDTEDLEFNSLETLSSAIKNLSYLDSRIYDNEMSIVSVNSLDKLEFSNDGSIDFIKELGLYDIDVVSGVIKISDDSIFSGLSFDYLYTGSDDVFTIHNSKGVATTTLDVLDSLVLDTGIVAKQVERLQERNGNLNRDIEYLKKRNDEYREELIETYSNMEKAMSQANSTMSFVNAFIDSMNGGN